MEELEGNLPVHPHRTSDNVCSRDINPFWAFQIMLATIGALITIGFGVFGAVAPHLAARLVSIAPVGGLGVSEIRATYGGLFIALGGACLVLESPVAYAVAGAAWLGAASMRLPSLFLDKGAFPKAIGGAAVEALPGVLLLTGAA